MSGMTISPKEARRLGDAGATLIDIREADEHGRERIAAEQLDSAAGARECYILEGGIEGSRGAGLVFAGISGFRGMARLLTLAPWNRIAASNGG